MQSVKPKENNIIIRYLIDLKRDMSNNSIKYLFVLPVTLFFIIFLVMPVFYVLGSAFFDNAGNFKLSFFKETFSNKLNIDWKGNDRNKNFERRDITRINQVHYIFNGVDHGRILNSIIIALATTVIALLIGVTLALYMSRREFRGKAIVSGMILVPLIIPPFVGGIGFIQMLGRNGVINKYFLLPNFGVKLIFDGIWAMVFVQALHYYTLIYLNVYSSLINIDPSLEEQAKNMGAKGFKLYRSVILPLALPGIAAGSILTFILSLEDVGTPLIFAELGGNVMARKTMTFYILKSATKETNDPNSIPPDVAVMGIVLVFFALIGFIIIRKYVSMRSYAMMSKGRAGERNIMSSGPKETIIFYFVFIILFLISIISHIGVILIAFSKLLSGDEFNPQWTLDNFKSIFGSSVGIVNAIKNTILFSVLAIILILIFGTMAAYALSRLDFRGKSIFDILITIPIALPGIVLGLGYLYMFSDTFAYNLFGLQEKTGFVFTFDPLIFPLILLICSYAVRKFPFAVRSIFAGLQQTSVTLEEAALNLGASKMKSIRSITIPLITLNMVAGGLIALVYTLGEVSTTLILISQSEDATITWVMAHSGNSLIGEIAALGILLMFIQVISIIISNVLLRDRAEAMTGI